MGIPVHPQTYQNKNIADNPDFDTLELQNYIYTVTKPNLYDLKPTQPWADEEFKERLALGLYPLNPGEAWKLRPEVWEQFLDKDGHFDYTYGERMWGQIDKIIGELEDNPDSRQLYLSIWNPKDILNAGGKERIPCSLGYLFQARQGELHMTYMMRSSDIATHFQNDVYLAYKLQKYVAAMVGIDVGRFTHYIGSLHIFRKDAKGIF